MENQTSSKGANVSNQYRGKGGMELIGRCWDTTGYCFTLYMLGYLPFINIIIIKYLISSQPSGLTFIVKNAYFLDKHTVSHKHHKGRVGRETEELPDASIWGDISKRGKHDWTVPIYIRGVLIVDL